MISLPRPQGRVWLRADGVALARRLHDVTLELTPGLTVLVGENGAGKSSLLDVLAGILAPERGTVSLGKDWPVIAAAAYAERSAAGDVIDRGSDVALLAPRQRARRIASLGQDSVDVEASVLERIAQGLAPRRGSRALLDDTAATRVRAVAGALALEDLLARDVTALSAGQRRRVEVARALIDDEAECVIIDEPHAAVDVRHQGLVSHALMARARSGAVVVVSVHDLAIAATIADRIIGLREGRLVVDGAATAAITSANIELLYGVRGALVMREAGGVAVMLPRPVDGSAPIAR